jgi:hypothetical protein
MKETDTLHSAGQLISVWKDDPSQLHSVIEFIGEWCCAGRVAINMEIIPANMAPHLFTLPALTGHNP